MANDYLALITKGEIELRVSARVLLQIYDDDDDGFVDTAAVEQLIEDASSYVLEFYYGNHTTVPTLDAIPPALRRLALDTAHAYMAMRHPEYVRADGHKMFDRVDKELKRLREAHTVTVLAPPDPPRNVGGTTGAIGDDASPDPPESFFDNMGDFA